MGENPLTDEREKLLEETLSHDVPPATRDALLRYPPLWYFVLVEAETTNEGKHLGPVGGRIVAEVLIGLLEGDPQSYLSQSPTWTPDTEELSLTASLPGARNGNSFTMSDLVQFVEAAPALG